MHIPIQKILSYVKQKDYSEKKLEIDTKGLFSFLSDRVMLFLYSHDMSSLRT